MFKDHQSDVMPYRRWKAEIRETIVNLGALKLDKVRSESHVSPAEWHELMQDEDVIVLDTRNDYEVEVGTFEGAIDPLTETFKQFPKWVEENRKALEGKKVAMFCTGGIRCEKYSAYMLEHGVEEVAATVVVSTRKIKEIKGRIGSARIVVQVLVKEGRLDFQTLFEFDVYEVECEDGKRVRRSD